MIAYDDDRTIADIEAHMDANPGVSRRAAIIHVAGKRQLRRIEIKMAARAAKDGLSAPATIGGASHLLRGDLELQDGVLMGIDGERFVLRTSGADKVLSMRGMDDFALPGDKLRVLHGPNVVDADVAVVVQNLGNARIRANPRTMSLGGLGKMLLIGGLLLMFVAMVLLLKRWDENALEGLVCFSTGFSAFIMGVLHAERREGRFVQGLLDLFGDRFLDENGEEQYAQGGYDDEASIASVRDLMRKDGLSRRAAIIRVAGENALRRIEMKMKRADEAQAPVVEGSFGFMRHHRLAGRPLKRDTGRIVEMAGHGFWLVNGPDRRFLRFDAAHAPQLVDGMSVELLRHEDQVVAIRTNKEVLCNKALVSVLPHYGAAAGLMSVPAAYVALFEPSGLMGSTLPHVAVLGIWCSMLVGAVWLLMLLLTGDGRLQRRPYEGIARLFP